ncbi:DUF2029 domain-containing protein [Alicyclobacillus cycloheptanicus]|uniref:4-amino-4-deoxy-L-arabinose transferase-like glycosyltransferase n=1 Tax=Alicyclobacillus cycloheptanicus TaxID=1457 RepID=A0ABT9XGG0_9BACL|nr:glycosyltransferase 87 family protein [Alicyclobacillus cycloheptanicus]MDQ0189154.1 4-amino-4-deoxy-L-arabinose transferase-like glycosyltransferase [Alicyclobacillus cycloheptanicus]WDM00347.1 DUF2029 domain-containing protein [Alicyclobacillus cycloheptanicus]
MRVRTCQAADGKRFERQTHWKGVGPSTRAAVFWLLLVNVVLRGAWLCWMHPPQLYDFAWYYQRAVSLLQGKGYVWNGHPTAYWPIGYPYFLSLVFHLTGPHVMAGLIANAVLSIGIVLLVYAIARVTLAATAWPARAAAFAAALGYSLLPSHIEWNAVLGSEELATFLLVLALWVYLVRPKAWWPVLAAGLCLGLSCDVRPIPLFFPVCIVCYERWSVRRSWGAALARAGGFAVMMLLAVSPVTVRNLLVLHHFILVSTNGGVNLWQGTHADGYYFWSSNPHVNPLLAAHGNEIQQNAIATHAAVQFILHHPLRTLIHGFAKIYFLYWVDWNDIGVTFGAMPNLSAVMGHIAGWFNTVVYWAFMAISLTGLWAWLRRMRARLALPVWYIAYYTAVFLFFPAWDRFRFPLMPLFAILLGMGWVWLFCRQRAEDDAARPVDDAAAIQTE